MYKYIIVSFLVLFFFAIYKHLIYKHLEICLCCFRCGLYFPIMLYLLDFQHVINFISVRYKLSIQTNNKNTIFYGLQSELIMLSIMLVCVRVFVVYYVKHKPRTNKAALLC